MTAHLLQGKKVLITAGPTREAIDPVRYISNHSSGKMGYAIAEKFLELGAEVILISGPVNIQLQHPRLKTIKVNAASEMYLASCKVFEEIDIAVFAAAVADYRPAKVSEQKIKKDETSFTIKMVKNIDIAYEFGKIKTNNQISVGFALETNDELSHAKNKLQKKNFDLVILNSMNDANATFGYDTNKITIINRDLIQKQFSLKQKTEVAKDIVREISSLLMKQFEYEEIRAFE
ncbi:MAG TPA: bifunctional phosphopantothenoylcysteine decarboxylase/phosphopantothenate--cysteine ligase CoaBC [Chitinophagaceae bacterium]|jgi:phosphopantothenoylcysteine decarboxylase/phosphopantothenate--cysteine ligase|nr:bifunctional phosphopantothenoylcysteine decarboxylase/phosphopantothenate--cysteine ligase CoaBC [Chitinophagaceae bacterium]